MHAQEQEIRAAGPERLEERHDKWHAAPDYFRPVAQVEKIPDVLAHVPFGQPRQLRRDLPDHVAGVGQRHGGVTQVMDRLQSPGAKLVRQLFHSQFGHSFDLVQQGRDPLPGGETDDRLRDDVGRDFPRLEFPGNVLPVLQPRNRAQVFTLAGERQLARRQPVVGQTGKQTAKLRPVRFDLQQRFVQSGDRPSTLAGLFHQRRQSGQAILSQADDHPATRPDVLKEIGRLALFELPALSDLNRDRFSRAQFPTVADFAQGSIPTFRALIVELQRQGVLGSIGRTANLEVRFRGQPVGQQWDKERRLVGGAGRYFFAPQFQRRFRQLAQGFLAQFSGGGQRQNLLNLGGVGAGGQRLGPGEMGANQSTRRQNRLAARFFETTGDQAQ